MKPIIYGLAFEAGLAHPETLIEDRPARFGIYVPKNFDEDFHGTVTIREALAQSLNIPAVKVLEALGPARLYGRMRRPASTPVLPKGAEPSLAIALGGVGMRPVDLATLYAGLGPRRRDRCASSTGATSAVAKPAAAPRQRLLSPVAAWYVTDILRNAPPPANAKAGPASPTRPAPPTATAMPGRSATTAATRSPSGSAGPTAPPRPGSPGAPPPRRCCSMPSRGCRPARAARRPRPPARSGTAGDRLPPPLKRFREARGTSRSADGAYLEPRRADRLPARPRRTRGRGRG